MKWTKIVLLLNLIVFKCWAMTLSELDEFKDFLEKTSQLDLNLKSNPDVDADDDNTVSDHAWEESGKFEGDLILNERQRRLIVEDVAEGLSRNGLRDSTKRWPDNEVVYFIQREHFTEDQLEAIQNGINDIAQASCVKFRPYKKGDRDAVVIQGSRRGCFSQVGYQGGYQVLNLNSRHPVGRGCFRHGTVVHEMLHTLGFYHMQSSPDRDDYIDVIWENILQPARHNFRKYNTFAVSDFGVGYDYDSVLHYSKKAFSSNGQDTLVPKQNGADIGQRVGLSQKDTQKLNKMYCDADSNSDDVESHNKKRPDKKNNTKNKPFEGHGIGYHQGKTVVIKLPAAETYRLPDMPTFHIFDYFSKTPQAVPQTFIASHGFGQKIMSSYDSAITKSDKVYNADVPANIELPNRYNISEVNREQPQNYVNKPKQTLRNDNDEDRKNSEGRLKTMSSDEEYKNEKSFKDLIKPFKILNIDIQKRVYPSNEYENKNNYSNLYDDDETPSVKHKPLRQKYSDTAKGTENKYYENDDYSHQTRNVGLLKPRIEYSNEYIKGRSGNNNQSFKKIDSTYRTSLPINHLKQFIKYPDMAAIKEDLYHRNNNMDVYIQKQKEANLELFGENIPYNEDWNKNNEFKEHVGEYDIASYSKNGNKNYMSLHELYKNMPNSFQQHDFRHSNSFVKGDPLFGVPVPLTKQAWYNIHNDNDSGENNKKEKYYK